MCIEDVTGEGWRAAEREKKPTKRKLEEAHWVICVCTFTLKGDDLLLYKTGLEMMVSSARRYKP